MTKQEFKTKAKNWWEKNKRVVKVGATCLAVGVCYGFVKGVNSYARGAALLMNESNPDSGDDTFAYNETTVDDPELLELIRLENESYQKENES